MSETPIVRRFLGYPPKWFESCNYSDCDGVERDGEIYLPGTAGNPIRMKDRYRKRAGWNMPNTNQ